MPKCDSCGAHYDDPSVMELVRNKDNRWISICRSCLTKGVDANRVVASRVAVDEAIAQSADEEAIDVNIVAGDPIANVRKLLESLRNLRNTNEKVGRVRSHDRKPVEMTVNFSLARDDAVHRGTVKNLSQGGMLINTDRQLSRGQILQFDWKSPVPPTMAQLLQGNAEVRRVVKNDDGTYAVGLRFVKRQAAKGANRRRFRRYKCDMQAYYQREGSELIMLGKVKDISQGGCMLVLDEELEGNETFYVRLVGGGGGRGDLVGTMQVRRVIPREPAFETGCLFLQMRIERLEDLGKVKPPTVAVPKVSVEPPAGGGQ